MTTIETTAPPARVVAQPMSRTERSLAPDIARGFMLLFIALANVPGYLYGRALGASGTLEGSSVLSRAAHGAIILFVEHRSRPMFAILYGFGMAMIASRFMARAADAGTDERRSRSLARRLLARRSLWLMVFGAVHATFLFFGDILLPYGVTGLIALGLVVASDKALRRGFWIFTAWCGLVGMPALAFSSILASSDGEVMPPPVGDTYIGAMGWGLVEAGADLVLVGILALFVPLVLAGVMLYRAGWITEPGAHLRPLRRAATVGLGVGVLSAVPTLVVAMGWWDAPLWARFAAAYLNVVGGAIAGFGYICAFALLAHALRGWGRRGPVRAIAALGERSLTGYLLQSVICAPLLSAWGMNLAEDRGYGFAFAFAVGAWLVTVLVALALDLAGKRGPFEVVLRKLTYR